MPKGWKFPSCPKPQPPACDTGDGCQPGSIHGPKGPLHFQEIPDSLAYPSTVWPSPWMAAWPGAGSKVSTFIPFPRRVSLVFSPLFCRDKKKPAAVAQAESRDHRLPYQWASKGWGQKYRPGTKGDVEL